METERYQCHCGAALEEHDAAGACARKGCKSYEWVGPHAPADYDGEPYDPELPEYRWDTDY